MCSIHQFFDHVHSLGFDDASNYVYLLRHFRELFNIQYVLWMIVMRMMMMIVMRMMMMIRIETVYILRVSSFSDS
jgi:hypothetical protein